jgi:hypothetical protein
MGSKGNDCHSSEHNIVDGQFFHEAPYRGWTLQRTLRGGGFKCFHSFKKLAKFRKVVRLAFQQLEGAFKRYKYRGFSLRGYVLELLFQI